MDIAKKLYRVGPAILTIVMVIASVIYYPWRHYGSWMGSTIVVGFFVVAFWHLLLIVAERRTRVYLMYAFINLPLYVIFGFYCLVLVTGEGT